MVTNSIHSPMTQMDTFITSLVDDALEAFWLIIAEQTLRSTGDLSPETSHRLSVIANAAVSEWLTANRHVERLRQGAKSRTPKKLPPAGHWSVTGSASPCHRFDIRLRTAQKFIARVGLVDIPSASDEANAYLIAAAPELHVALKTTVCTIEDRLATLRDDQSTLTNSNADRDVDDQIDHYESLLRLCNKALRKACVP
ncbi:MAG: hypothetical protein U0936_26050 [Planctomycetaceae bacterium]